MAGIVLDRVKKRFGAVDVVESLSLDVADGEFVVLVGPSGCGKSTTLRIVAGLEDLTGGTVSIGGRDVTALEPKDRNIAMVFQNYALYPHKTVYENLAFGLRLRKTPAEDIKTQVNWAAGMLGIEKLLDRKPRQLSGGQMQRVSLGRALVRRPDAFLLDEPLSNLDAKLRVHMREEIGLLHKRIGTSMIYVTHDQVEAMTLGDRIVVMHGGRAQQIGTPLKIYDEPANRFVAGFLGAPEMNFIEGAVTANDGTLRFCGGGIDVTVPMGRFVLAPGAGPHPVTLGIRPEHLRLDGHAAPGTVGIADHIHLSATVKLIEQMGAQTMMICDTGDGRALRVLSERSDDHRVGASCALAVCRTRVHLFDTTTGTSLLNAAPPQ
ncbi:ABC transporter ATP-binding protein [Alcaligenaceae bacterium A4P071]|nr:ABC transporter ATP-binding protein [Alcaligenaceae bacterium A4P071]